MSNPFKLEDLPCWDDADELEGLIRDCLGRMHLIGRRKNLINNLMDLSILLEDDCSNESDPWAEQMREQFEAPNHEGHE